MIFKIILTSGLAGLTVFVGGVLAILFRYHVPKTPVKKEITHLMMAFGGGVILSALALILIPRGMETLKLLPLCISFSGGAILFFYLDRILSRNVGRVAMLLAMLLDFIPESIILGAMFSMDPATAILLGVIIGLQNLPEAFSSFRNLIFSGIKKNKLLFIYLLLSFSGIAGALLGYYVLSDAPVWKAHLMIAASGGILYLVFHDIAPKSSMKNTWYPSLGATAGFLMGMIGEKII